jgi:hypothetical protein
MPTYNLKYTNDTSTKDNGAIIYDMGKIREGKYANFFPYNLHSKSPNGHGWTWDYRLGTKENGKYLYHNLSEEEVDKCRWVSPTHGVPLSEQTDEDYLKQAWKTYHKHGNQVYYYCIPSDEASYIGPDGAIRKQPCPGTDAVQRSWGTILESFNLFENTLTCVYPEYSIENNKDAEVIDYISTDNNPGAKYDGSDIRQLYADYYNKKCKAQQEIVHKKGNAISTDHISECYNKKEHLKTCSTLGIPKDECYFSDGQFYKKICIEDKEAQKGKFKKNGSKYVFDFDDNYTSINGAAKKFCSDVGAIKEYNKRLTRTKLNDVNLTNNPGITGDDYKSMTELVKQCKNNKKIDPKTGEVTKIPLDVITCNVNTLATDKYNYEANSRTFSGNNEIKTSVDRMLNAQNDAEINADRRHNQNMQGTRDLINVTNNLGTVGADANELINNLIGNDQPTPTPPRDDDDDDDDDDDKKKKNYKFIIMIVFVILIILVGVFLIL